jgi:hypothetical protein
LVGPEDGVTKTYNFHIPKSYRPIKGDQGRISFMTVYPGMVGLTEENRQRFYNDIGAWGPDRVNIRVSIDTNKSKIVNEFKNRNDPGRYIYENTILRNLSYEKIPTPLAIKEHEKITKYILPNFKNGQGIYLIKHDDNRLSIIHCVYKNLCSGQTTWHGVFSIGYDFMRIHFNHMIDIDRAVLNLIEQFSPTQVN